MTDLAIVLRSLRVRLFSTAVTVLLVGLAVALLLTLLSLRSAGNAAFLRGSGNAHLLVSADASPLVSVLNAIFYAGAPQRPITQAKFREVAESFPWVWAIPMQQGDSYRGFPTVATTAAFFTSFEPVDGVPWAFSEGRAFARPFEVVLGSAVARETGLRVGAKLVLTHGIGHGDGEHGHVHDEYQYEVVGILAPTGSAHDRALFTDLDSSWILHAHDRRKRDGLHGTTTVADLVDADRLITGLLLRTPTRDGSSLSGALQQQHDRLRRDPTLTVAVPANEIRKLLVIVGRMEALFVAMAGAILLSSSIAILLAMVNSMRERRRQVAIFRVLGASRFRVFGLVLTESALIGLLGGAAGVLLSVIGTAAAAWYLREEVGLVLGLAVDPRSAVVVAALAAVLAAVAGVIPALLAYRTPVADELKPTG